MRTGRTSFRKLLIAIGKRSLIICGQALETARFFCYTFEARELLMPAPAQLIRFGVFELDLDVNELRKNGRKVRLQDQPFRLLNLLIESPGQPISREKMKEALWPADTFVDFDHSLNAAIAKLRVALGDPAENPRFVETVARKGYRFIAPVELVCASNGVLMPTEIHLSVNGAQPALPPNRVSKARWILLCIGAALVLASAGFWFWKTRPSAETELVRLTNDAGLSTDPAVSPDGKLLAYASDRGSGGNLNIWIQQLGPGGSAVQLTRYDSDADHPAFSPDGSTLAFHSNKDGGGIYLVPVIGGEPSRLVPFGKGPRFSPDGRWIAYSSGANNGGRVLSGNGSGGIFVVPVTGGKPRRVGGDVQGPASPLWSPDGRHLLAYVPPKLGFLWSNADWWLLSIDGEPSHRTGNFSELRRQGFSLGFDRVPSATEWTANFITFAAGFGDSVNVWRAPISQNGRISGPASRLTSGTTLEVEPALGANGDLTFASLNRNAAVWSLTADTDLGKIVGQIGRVTKGPAEMMPSISPDGERIVYTAARGRATLSASDSALPEAVILQTHLRDFSTGKETVVADSGTPQWHPQISRDGSMVSYTSGKPGELFATSFGEPSPRVILAGENCFTWDWSLDKKRLLYGAGDGVQNQQLYSLEVSSGHKTLLLSKPGFTFFQAKFSPHDEAIAVLGCHEDDRAVTQCQIFIVPLENYVAAPSDRWIPINHASQWDDKPRWSSNGGLLYFISDRDGFLCLWAQRVAAATKQPIGSPFAVYHFHNTRLAMSNLDTGFLEMDVAKNKIVLGLGEVTGDIWSARKRP